LNKIASLGREFAMIIREKAMLGRCLLGATILLTLLFVEGCERSQKQQPLSKGQLVAENIDAPVPLDSIVPQVFARSNGEIVLSWLEPLPTKGYAFRIAIRSGNTWSDVRTISSGTEISMFQADLPGVTEMQDGRLLAYWQVSDKTNGDPYATIIQVASSNDAGRTWSAPVTPYPMGHPGQHGFISAFPVAGNVGLVWLDAEQQRYFPAKNGNKEDWKGAIGLRYTSLDANGRPQADLFVDPITCECCPTAAAVSARGPVVVYRGRREPQNANPSDTEIYKPTVRDIQISRLENGKWTKPHTIFNDNWVMNACPDNGPAVDAVGNEIVVAWWTAAGNQPSVKVAFSSDAGDTFTKPIRMDNGAGAGQVTVALSGDQQGALVGWLESNQVWARWVSRDGRLGTPLSLGPAAGRRLPRWIAAHGEVFAVGTMQEQNEKRSVRAFRLKLSPGAV
jgi:hypothetical protein